MAIENITYNQPDEARQENAQSALRRFDTEAAHVSFESAACFPLTARRIPRGLGQFGFVALHPITMRQDYKDRLYGRCATPQGVFIRRRTYLDQRNGLGLVGDKNGVRTLCATSTLGINPETGRLHITQIQGVTLRDESPDSAFGLNNGFLWRHTLVRAMAKIVTRLGADSLEIVSAENNDYNVTSEGYDNVARDLGFSPDPNLNWEANLPLAPTEHYFTLDQLPRPRRRTSTLALAAPTTAPNSASLAP